MVFNPLIKVGQTAGGLPVLSLVIQVCKRLTLPVSRRIIKYGKSHPSFRNYFLILPGRYYHRLEMRSKSLFEQNEAIKKQEEKLQPLEDSAAEAIGTQIMIECAALVIFVWLSMSESKAKSLSGENRRLKDLEDLKNWKNELERKIEDQKATIQELRTLLRRTL